MSTAPGRKHQLRDGRVGRHEVGATNSILLAPSARRNVGFDQWSRGSSKQQRSKADKEAGFHEPAYLVRQSCRHRFANTLVRIQWTVRTIGPPNMGVRHGYVALVKIEKLTGDDSGEGQGGLTPCVQPAAPSSAA